MCKRCRVLKKPERLLVPMTVEVIEVVDEISPPVVDASDGAVDEVVERLAATQQAKPSITTTSIKEPETVKVAPIFARGLAQLLGGPSAVLPRSTL